MKNEKKTFKKCLHTLIIFLLVLWYVAYVLPLGYWFFYHACLDGVFNRTTMCVEENGGHIEMHKKGK